MEKLLSVSYDKKRMDILIIAKEMCLSIIARKSCKFLLTERGKSLRIKRIPGREEEIVCVWRTKKKEIP